MLVSVGRELSATLGPHSRLHLWHQHLSSTLPTCTACWLQREQGCQQPLDPTASVIFGINTFHPLHQSLQPADFGGKRAVSNPWTPQQASPLASLPFTQSANLHSVLASAGTGCQQPLDPTASVIFGISTFHPLHLSLQPAGFGGKRAASNPWTPQQASLLASSPFTQSANWHSLLVSAGRGLPAPLGSHGKRLLWHQHLSSTPPILTACWFWREESCQQPLDPTACVTFGIITLHPICHLAQSAGFDGKRAASNSWIPQPASSLASTPFIHSANLYSPLVSAGRELPATLGPHSKCRLWHHHPSFYLPTWLACWSWQKQGCQQLLDPQQALSLALSFSTQLARLQSSAEFSGRWLSFCVPFSAGKDMAPVCLVKEPKAAFVVYVSSRGSVFCGVVHSLTLRDIYSRSSKHLSHIYMDAISVNTIV